MRINGLPHNSNRSFGHLFIDNPDDWDGKTLNKFVNNKEIQKLTDTYNRCHKDIHAVYTDGYIVLKEGKDGWGYQNEITEIKPSQLRSIMGFSVNKFLNKEAKEAIKKMRDNSIKDKALKALKEFNDTLCNHGTIDI